MRQRRQVGASERRYHAILVLISSLVSRLLNLDSPMLKAVGGCSIQMDAVIRWLAERMPLGSKQSGLACTLPCRLTLGREQTL